MKTLHNLGKYMELLFRTFGVPERWSVFFRQVFDEIYKLGVNSILIVIFISIFIGSVIVLQISLNIDSPIIPSFTVGYVTREIVTLEFSSTIMCLILAGKVGSNIASEIGTMRVTEQIDALDIMGINPASYLILPKITGLMLFMPVLVIFSLFFGIMGGYFICMATNIVTVAHYEYGLLYWFNPFNIWYSIIKGVWFAFLIASIASFFGYNIKGGALDVGKASTNSVVTSSVLILLSDLIITQLIMS